MVHVSFKVSRTKLEYHFLSSQMGIYFYGQGCKKIMIFLKKSKKSDLFDLNQIFLI